MPASNFTPPHSSPLPSTSTSRVYSDLVLPYLQAQGTHYIPAPGVGQTAQGHTPNDSLYSAFRRPGPSEAAATNEDHSRRSSLHTYSASAIANRHHRPPTSHLSAARAPYYRRALPHNPAYSTNKLPDDTSSSSLATSSSLVPSRSTSNSPLSQVSLGPSNTTGSVTSDFTSISSTSDEGRSEPSHFTFSVPYPYPPATEYRNNFPSQDPRSLSDIRSPTSLFNTKDSITGLSGVPQDPWVRHRVGRIASHRTAHSPSFEQQQFVKTESAESDDSYLYRSQLLQNHTPFTQLTDTMSYHGHPPGLQQNPMPLSLDTLSALRTAAPESTFDESADDFDGDEREDDQDTLSPLTSRPTGSVGYGLDMNAGYGFSTGNSSGATNNSMGNGRKAEKEKQVRRRSSKGV